MMYPTETAMAMHRARMLDMHRIRITKGRRGTKGRRRDLTVRPSPGLVLAR